MSETQNYSAPMDSESILAALPYGPGFRFVDTIDYIDEQGVRGSCYLDPDWPFFKAHFVNYPVVPGVLLTEVMAQIGLACLAVYLNHSPVNSGPVSDREAFQPDGESPQVPMSADHKLWVFSSAELQFLKPVFPGERVRAESERIYYRFGKLKCRVQLYNEADVLVCEGLLAGMMVDRPSTGVR